MQGARRAPAQPEPVRAQPALDAARAASRRPEALAARWASPAARARRQERAGTGMRARAARPSGVRAKRLLECNPDKSSSYYQTPPTSTAADGLTAAPRARKSCEPKLTERIGTTRPAPRSSL